MNAIINTKYMSVEDRLLPYLGDLPFELRNAALKALCDKEGIRLPETFRPEGSALIEVGESAKAQLKRDINLLPDFQPALYGFRASLKAEQAHDLKVSPNALTIDEFTGALAREGAARLKNLLQFPRLNFTRETFSQLANFVKPDSVRSGYASTLLSLSPSIRKSAFDYHARNAKSQEVVLRTLRDEGNKPYLRAVTSTMHSGFDGDDSMTVAALLGVDIPKGGKVRVTRDFGGSFSRIEIIFPAMERQLVVGDLAYVFIKIENSETCKGRLKVSCGVLRVLCYNFTTAESDDSRFETMQVNHVGDLAPKLRRMIANALNRIDPFVKAFGDAYRDPFPENKTRGEVLEQLGKAFDLSKATIETAQNLWDVDGDKSAGNTRAGAVHALTRASQLLDSQAASKLEAQAGRLILDGWDSL